MCQKLKILFKKEFEVNFSFISLGALILKMSLLRLDKILEKPLLCPNPLAPSHLKLSLERLEKSREKSLHLSSSPNP